MCISLVPLSVGGTFITANKKNGKYVITYSNDTKTIQTSSGKKNLLGEVRSSSNSQSVNAWFLPIKGFCFDEIEIINLTANDKQDIKDLRSFIEKQKENNTTRSKSISFNTRSAADVITLADGSQVVRASSPKAILEVIDKVDKAFRDNLQQTAQKAIDACNDIYELANSTCLVYLFIGDNKITRNTLAYSVPATSNICYLPTIENSHDTDLSIPQKVIRDGFSFLWGSDVATDYSMPFSEISTPVAPANILGTFDFGSCYPGLNVPNGFISIDFGNIDSSNINYNIDESDALNIETIFV